MKKILKATLFFLSLIIIFFTLSNIFIHKQVNQPWDITKKIKGFYSEPKNSLDVVFVGSSHAFMGISPMEIWSKYGIPSYMFGANEQPFWISYHYIKEVLKTQKPKVIILDVLYGHRYNEYERDGVNSLNLMQLNLSLNKIEAINTSVPKDERKKYYFPIYAFHDRWKNLNKEDFKIFSKDSNDNFFKGYTMGTATQNFDIDLTKERITETHKRPEKIEKYFQKIIDLTKENQVELILIKTPYPDGVTNVNHQKSYNRIQEIAMNNNVKFLNFNNLNLLKKLNFNFKTDMNDAGHLNYNGARKISNYLGEFLKNNYKLKNKKNIKGYKKWNNQEKIYFSKIAKFQLRHKDSLAEYVNELKKINDVLIIISSMDETSRQYEKFKTILNSLNLKLDLSSKNRWSYLGIVNSNGKNYIEKLENKKIQEEFKIENNTIQIISSGYTNGNLSSIKVNGKEYSKKKRGLNIVIYDYKNNIVLDSINVDTHEDTNLKVIH